MRQTGPRTRMLESESTDPAFAVEIEHRIFIEVAGFDDFLSL
jgi:hypothetical protein